MTRISGLGVTHNDFHVEKPDGFDPGGSGSGSGAPFGFHDGGRTRDLLGAVYGNGWHGPSGVVGEAHRGTGAGATPSSSKAATKYVATAAGSHAVRDWPSMAAEAEGHRCSLGCVGRR
jgi:hypothetical protein